MSLSAEQIGATLGFTVEELTLNGAGQVSAHQVCVSVRAAMIFSLLAVMAAGLVVVMLVVKVNVLYRIWGIACCIFGAGLFGTLGVKSARAVATRQVLSAQGPLKMRPGSRTIVNLTIGPWTDGVPD